MNIKVIKTKGRDVATDETGGEYAVQGVTIYIDERLSKRMQRNNVIHAVIENFNLGMCHDRVELLIEKIRDALDQL